MRNFGFILVLVLSSGCVNEGFYSQGKIGGPFKKYDTALQDSITHRWGKLVDSKWPDRYGKIVLQFRLNCDGSISDIRVLEDEVGAGQAAICQKSVSSLAPFPHWPQDMIRSVGVNYREIAFTFKYYK